MDGKQKRFLVLGLGPVGGIFGACLSSVGHQVCGVDIWEEHVDRIRAEGVQITGIDDRTVRLHEVHTSVAGLETKDFDYVMVALKAPVMPSVVPDIQALDGDFKVVSLQNGIDNEEYLAEQFGRDRTMRVVVNYAGGIEAPGRLQKTFFNPPNYVGCLCSESDCAHAQDLGLIMTEAGLVTEATDDMKKYIWQKTTLNAALSPVCALLDMTMAEVMSCPETYRLVEAILGECLRVAKARGYKFGEGFLDDSLDYLSRAGDHRPSMLLDLKRGQQTEIDFLNGMIASHGVRLGVPVPINSSITAMVKALDKKNLERKQA